MIHKMTEDEFQSELSQCGLKAIILVVFDTTLGPVIAFEKVFNENSRFIETLRDPMLLAQFHMGVADTSIDSIDFKGEKIIIARNERQTDNTVVKDLLFFIIDSSVPVQPFIEESEMILEEAEGDLINFDGWIKTIDPNRLNNRINEYKSKEKPQITQVDLLTFSRQKIPIISKEQKYKILKGSLAAELVRKYDLEMINKILSHTDNNRSLLQIWKKLGIGFDLSLIYSFFISLYELGLCNFEEKRTYLSGFTQLGKIS